jgi:hypothetical protein
MLRGRRRTQEKAWKLRKKDWREDGEQSQTQVQEDWKVKGAFH